MSRIKSMNQFKIKAEYTPADDPSTITFLKEKVSYGARGGKIIFNYVAESI